MKKEMSQVTQDKALSFPESVLERIKQHKKISAVVLIIVLFILWRTLFAGSSNAAPQYQTAQAVKETLVSSVSESGQVAVANRVAVTTGTTGIVSHVYVKSGDTVTAGETVADVTLDIAGQQRQAQAWSNYLTAKNSFNAANANLNTLQSTMFVANQAFVNDRGVINPSSTQMSDPKYIEENATWLAAEAAYENQTNVIAQSQVAVSNAFLAYESVSSTIVAPANGVITDLTITPGMQLGGSNTTVGGSNGTTLSTVANIKSGGTPTISVSLSEVDVAKVKTGDKATLSFDALPNQTFTGKVIGINTTGTVVSGVTSYPATIVLDTQNDSILPNMSVTANIITGIKDNALAVPTAAIQSSGGQSTVRVLNNGALTVVPVTTGVSSSTDTEILSGLNEGDTVVVGFVPTTTGGSAASSPFSSSNPFRGIGGGGFGGGGGGGGARGGGTVRVGGGG